ncbi:MAG TPA: cytochrome c oxidase subunit 3 [Micromonosporaceae bacterium]|jgi:heme/copper-type cytochrome/quinol oxidase subunit 3
MTTLDPDTVPRPAAANLDRQAARGASSALLAMILFVASEGVFFAAFLGIYASAFTDAEVWPPPEVPLASLGLPSAALAALVLSAITLAVPVRQARRGRYTAATTTWLATTIVFAAAFVALLMYGYADLGFGIGQGVYESLFYVINALAVAHGVGGIFLMALVLLRLRGAAPTAQREPVLVAGVYWYFVVAVGVIIYVLLYLAAS